jgi:3,4-dihydroxy 2-butanone 4-phosphate synthase/GTP cyclohydrolase II
MNQEGRGIGLAKKIEAYALQEKGLDTVEANLALGFQQDERDYWLAAQVLKKMNISQIKLMTNNPNKINQLKKYGIDISKRMPIIVPAVKENLAYLKTKQEKLGHLLHL